MKQVSDLKLDKYFDLTERAYKKAKKAEKKVNTRNAREEFLDMISRYINDAKYFKDKGDKVTAFAALNYAHGWLDAGAWIGLWKVNDSRLFTVDEESSN
tara:strand:- start:6747 stop:7043 length:297 start_codon:yes stop_codon:yes gene_type:complete